MVRFIRKIISTLFVLILLISFGLHSNQVKHTHYVKTNDGEHQHTHSEHSDQNQTEHGEESLGEKMHMADKKFFFFVFGATIIFSAFTQLPWISYRRILLYTNTRIRFIETQYRNRISLYIHFFYALGILNPKLY